MNGKSTEYVIGDEARELFPLELDFTGMTDGDENPDKRTIMRYVGRNFTATFPDKEYVTRRMMEDEKAALRGDYCQLVENVLPERRRQMEEAIEEAKRMRKEAEERYASALQEISAMAAEVKMGTVETCIKGTDTFCMALAGYYLYYTWDEASKTFLLAKATPITDTSLWASDEKNRDMMRQHFGYEFPENEQTTNGLSDF